MDFHISASLADIDLYLQNHFVQFCRHGDSGRNYSAYARLVHREIRYIHPYTDADLGFYLYRLRATCEDFYGSVRGVVISDNLDHALALHYSSLINMRYLYAYVPDVVPYGPEIVEGVDLIEDSLRRQLIIIDNLYDPHKRAAIFLDMISRHIRDFHDFARETLFRDL